MALLLAVGVYSLVNWQYNTAKPDTQKLMMSDASFGEENINWMKADTFQQLVTKAYYPNAEVSRVSNLMIVRIEGANTGAQDFYNGNEALLKMKVTENQFEIDYDRHNFALVARFKMRDSLVAVPNDVLIKLIDKTIN